MKSQGEQILFRAKLKFKRAVNLATCNTNETRNGASAHHGPRTFLLQSPTYFALPASGWWSALPMVGARAWFCHVSHMHAWSTVPPGNPVCVCMFLCVRWAVCQVHCEACAPRRAQGCCL